SDVVSAFNSTTMLEAAVAGKPVVHPMFAEAATDSYADWILLRERQEELFDVARSPEDYERTIEARLEDWSPTPDLMRRRREAFEAWIAPLDRGVADSYVK